MTRPAKTSALGGLQTVIYSALTAAGLTVRDEPGENTVFPYATIGESNAEEVGSKTDFGDDVYETIHYWSRAKGFKEAKTAVNTIISALSGYTYTVTGFRVHFADVDAVQTFRDPDGLTRHAVVRVKYKVFQE